MQKEHSKPRESAKQKLLLNLPQYLSQQASTLFVSTTGTSEEKKRRKALKNRSVPPVLQQRARRTAPQRAVQRRRRLQLTAAPAHHAFQLTRAVATAGAGRPRRGARPARLVCRASNTRGERQFKHVLAPAAPQPGGPPPRRNRRRSLQQLRAAAADHERRAPQDRAALVLPRDRRPLAVAAG